MSDQFKHLLTSIFQSPSRRLDLLITLLGLLGMVLFLAFYDRAFPSAALDLKLSRDEIAQRAQAYLKTQGYDLQGYEFALSFGEDWSASVYLQRTLGIPETNRLIRAERLPIWAWYARWFRPLQKEEFTVSLAPNGEVTAFSHTILEDAPGPSLPSDQARAIAEDYLVSDQRLSLADWEPTSTSAQKQPGGRTDHFFEWKRPGLTIGDADLRLAVTVQGDRVGSHSTWLRVPEAFQRQFAEQNSRAGFFSNLSYTLGFLGFGLAGLLAYLIGVWRGGLSWRAGLVPALAVAVVSLLAGLNALPLYKSGYGTTQDYTLFWLEAVFNQVLSAAFSAVPVLILWAGGSYLSKQAWPRQDKILPRGDDRWQILAGSGWRGLMLAGLMGGYTVLFYLIATQWLGGWTPLDIPYTSLYATPFPFMGPLEGGLLPATTEELFFRLVGISLLLWLARRRWLALLVPGALWAFAHLTYVRDPFYLRGIELTITSVFLLGLFFLRFDLTTTIIAHFAYNASLGALPLLRSGNPYFVISGAIVIAAMLAPLLPGALRRLQGKASSATRPQIQPGTAADLDKLASLAVEGLDWPALLADPAVEVLCLHAGNEVIGAAAGRVAERGPGEVLAFHVAPAWRRRYWGSTLADALCARLLARGTESVQVTAPAGDPVIAAFWTNQGWQPAVKVFTWSPAASRLSGWRAVIGRLGAKRQAKSSKSPFGA
jgi:hypothetical protein